MSSESTTAVVIRAVEFSETSLIVTLLTRDFGRISAMAKGARRPKGSFEGSLDLLSVCRVAVIRKPGDRLDLLTEAKLHRRFRAGQRSIDRLYAGYAVVELLRLFLDDDEPHAEVYDLTIRTLAAIDRRDEPPLRNGLVSPDTNAAAALLRFEIQLLSLLGHRPSLNVCTECGQNLARTEPPRPEPPRPGAAAHAGKQNSAVAERIGDYHRKTLSFSLEAGGLVCDDCRTRQRRTVWITPAAADALDRLANTEASIVTDSAVSISPDANESIGIDAAVYASLRSLVDRYVQTIAGREPRMQPFAPRKLTVG